MTEIQIQGSNNSTSLVLASNAASITINTPVNKKTETIDVSNNANGSNNVDISNNANGSNNVDISNNNSVINYSVMSEVKALGKLNCLVKSDGPKYGVYDASTNTWTGIDVDYCRAIAAVLGVETDFSNSIVPAFEAADDYWAAFANKDISTNYHIAIRQATHTAVRDLVELRDGLPPVDFGPVYLYEESALIVADGSTNLSNPPTLQDLSGLKIVVGKGTVQESTLPAFLAKNNVTANVVIAPNGSAAVGMLLQGQVDILANEFGLLSGVVDPLKNGAFGPSFPNAVLPVEFTFGISPLAPVVHEKDHAMQEAAHYALQAVIQASVDGITKAHLESGGSWLVPDISNDIFVSDWAKKAVIAFGGNYKERVEHYSLNNIPGNYNKTYNEGGLIANIALA